MPSNFFGINKCKELLNIDITDTADDELLTTLGEVSNQHMDNILRQHDEKIPLKVPTILADVKMAANYYVCSLFRGKRGDNETAKFWKDMFTDTINAVIDDRAIDDISYTAHRFNGRSYSTPEEFKLW